jgi:hypothetical protein
MPCTEFSAGHHEEHSRVGNVGKLCGAWWQCIKHKMASLTGPFLGKLPNSPTGQTNRAAHHFEMNKMDLLVGDAKMCAARNKSVLLFFVFSQEPGHSFRTARGRTLLTSFCDAD